MSIVRVREHVNPLSRKYQTVVSPPAWDRIYAMPSQPLHLDIGCGRGRFLLQMAQRQPDWNFLGVEIREPLVEQANGYIAELELTNLRYLFCNINNSLRSLLNSLPTGTLQRVTIQFPDPWFKRKHKTRRVVQPDLVADLAEFLAVGGTIFLQSDIQEVAEEMRDRVAAHPAFVPSQPDWLPLNPLPIATERELSTLKSGAPVYRTLFVKVSNTLSANFDLRSTDG
jgi:tRNA (guanine-N7-)-methyltransferase